MPDYAGKDTERTITSWLRRFLAEHQNGIAAGIGEDCAVIPVREKEFLLLTADALVEGTHFRREWLSMRELGIKAVAQSAADICSCGGVPGTVLVSIVCPPREAEETVKGIMRGAKKAAERHSARIVGGNISRGKHLAVTTAMTGRAEREMLCLRSTARPGEAICVSGPLGKSAAGLSLLRKGIANERLTRHFRKPFADVDAARRIARISRCMTDLSDGLVEGVRNICEASGAGAEISLEKVPVSREALKASEILGIDAKYLAVAGGEEAEWLFTLGKERIKEAKRSLPNMAVVGEVNSRAFGIRVISGGKPVSVKQWFRHF